MSAFTQKAIREAFLKLLHEKPLSKITIRSIADGADEQDAVEGLIALVNSGFAE